MSSCTASNPKMRFREDEQVTTLRRRRATQLLGSLLYLCFLIWAVLLAGRAATARVLNYMAALLLSPLYVLCYYLALP